MAGRGIFGTLIVRGRSVLQMNDSAETATSGIPDGAIRLYHDGTNQYLQSFSLATGAWETFNPAALLAPANADYLVGTADAGLSAEIVVGASPGGELGGTWASPTVDGTHSGSAHHTKYTDAEAISAIEGEATLAFTGGGSFAANVQFPRVVTTTDLNTNEITERTGGSGVTIDGLLVKDGQVDGVDPSAHAADSDAHHAQSHTHASHTGVGANDHHNESHTVASHSDTTGTGAELNTLTDGSNADSLHAHALGPTTVSKTADETVTSNATLQNDNHLTFSVAANTIYKVIGTIVYTTGSTPDIKFGWSLPASTAYAFHADFVDGNGTPVGTGQWSDDGDTVLVAGPQTTAERAVLTFAGIVSVAGTAGSVTVQWAQRTSNASNTTVNDGSWITYEIVS